MMAMVVYLDVLTYFWLLEVSRSVMIYTFHRKFMQFCYPSAVNLFGRQNCEQEI
jgi:hypothetical protein